MRRLWLWNTHGSPGPPSTRCSSLCCSRWRWVSSWFQSYAVLAWPCPSPASYPSLSHFSSSSAGSASGGAQQTWTHRRRGSGLSWLPGSLHPPQVRKLYLSPPGYSDCFFSLTLPFSWEVFDCRNYSFSESKAWTSARNFSSTFGSYIVSPCSPSHPHPRMRLVDPFLWFLYPRIWCA